MFLNLLHLVVNFRRTGKVVFTMLFILPFFFTTSLKAQGLPLPELEEKFKFYSKAHPVNLLFVHTDKTMYTNNETIWFCGYLVKNEATTVKDHNLLSVALMREDAGKLVLQAKYLMQQGLSFGSFTLADSISPGDYQLIAYTNVLNEKGDPLALFTQSLTIKNITNQNFNAELALLDTSAAGDFVRAKLTVAVKEYEATEKVSFSYAVNKHPERSATLKKGENNFIITIPKAQLNQLKPTLFTTVKYKNKTQHLSIRLPEPKTGTVKVRFFPEGGHLAEGLENVVAWEAKNSFDQPVAVTGILYRDGRSLDTISTNSYGAGIFKLNPNTGSRYTFKISANTYLNRDSIYTLPAVLENNIVLHLPNAIVNDTLRLRLQSKTPKLVQVVVHDFKNIYTSFFARAVPAGPDLSLILGPGVPKGITTITVLDTAARPLAERLFFAHHDQKINVQLNFDKTSYKRKDSVNVSIKLSGSDGQPAKGIVSVAAVQDNRIEATKCQDIESYVYLSDNLGVLPQHPMGRGMNSKAYLEDILRIRGWRRYTWQDLAGSTAADTVFKTQSPTIQGRVLHFNKVPKKPVDVISMRDSAITLINTDTNGAFQLNSNNALIVEGRTLFLTVNKEKALKEDYSLRIEDPFIAVNARVAARTEIPVSGLSLRINSKDLELKGLTHAIALKEVIIKADEDALYGGNECGDYVCRYNILNCPNHYQSYGNRAPVKGQKYLDGNAIGNGVRIIPTIVYQGCTGDSNRGTVIGEGIYTAREFYGVNMDDTGLLETQFLSTLAWEPGLVSSNDGEIRTSFATGDITGKFRIIVQGVAVQDVIFGENVFIVK